MVAALIYATVISLTALFGFGDQAPGARAKVGKIFEACKTVECRNSPAVPYVQIGKK